MTNQVNFNPFIKNIQYVDLEAFEKEIKEQKPQTSVINGDSQDDENVEIRIMTPETQQLFNDAKKIGMKDEVNNNRDELMRELQKFVYKFAQKYQQENPDVTKSEEFINSLTGGFADQYLAEVKNDKTIIMSDAVQEFQMFATDKLDQREKGEKASKAVVANEASGSTDKFNNLYDSVQYAENKNSEYGNYVSNDEGKTIRNNASEYIVNQMLKDNTDLLDQINPSFEYYGEYRQASKCLEQAKGETDPAKAKELISQAKDYIKQLLEYTSTNRLADTINDNKPGAAADVLRNAAVGGKDKYKDMASTAYDVTSRHSTFGRGISYSESKELLGKTTDFIMSQMLSENGSMGFLKDIMPDYKNNQYYQGACKSITEAQNTTNPEIAKEKLSQAKQYLTSMLQNVGTDNIADTVKGYGAHRSHHNHNQCSSQWGDDYNNRFGASRNQNRLYNAAQDVGLPEGNIRPVRNWFGGVNSGAVYEAKNEISNYVRELKQELMYSVRSRGEINKIFKALDSAAQNFDIKSFFKNNSHGNSVSNADLVAEVVAKAQAILKNEAKIEQSREDGSDPHNRNLMESKYLVHEAGSRISKKEKAQIAASYAKYVIQAIMADPSNVNLLSSLGNRSYFDSKSFDFVSVRKCMSEIKQLLQNPPSDGRKFDKQMQKITKEIEALLNKMETGELRNQVLNQGHNHW